MTTDIFNLSETEQCLHSLKEMSHPLKNAEPCIFVIFGATGDLTSRKLIPALYHLAKGGQLPANFACVGFARREKSDDEFRQEMYSAVKKRIDAEDEFDDELWDKFQERLFYHRSNFDDDSGYEELEKALKKWEKQFQTKGNRLFYLATPPSHFPLIIEKLHRNQLVYDANDEKEKWSRVIIEKPFGHDLKSAIKLQSEIAQHLDESQIYRIDHWLGKETVQNLLLFRFSNPIFETVWNNRHIDHVQITVAEDLGIGTRGHFWEEAGMLRDIVQNHMVQLLTLVAMEPPINFNADSIQDEKVKVIAAIRPFDLQNCNHLVVRGQYGSGFINGEQIKGYREEENVSTQSNVETYVALELHIDNWRWNGTPFYLRAGKRLPKRTTEITIVFHDAPSFLFKDRTKKVEPNKLIIRIQPDEGITLKMNCKVPGLGGQIKPVKMDFHYSSAFGTSQPEAYQRLICDCMSGDRTLFSRVDEVLGSWRIFDPILESWNKHTATDFPNYGGGTWGPEAAEKLIQKAGRNWSVL